MKTIKKYGKVITVLMIVIVAAAVMIWATFSGAEPIDRYSAGWQLIRETASEDGASFSAVYDLTGVGSTAGNFASKDSSTVVNGGPYYIRSTSGATFSDYRAAGQRWMFAFCGENFNNVDDTFSFNLVGWAKDNGMLQNICEGSCTLGTQAVVIYPDGGDALGATCSVTGVTYTHATTTFVDTGDTGSFDGAAVGMLARVTGTNITDGIVQVTTVTDANTIVCSGVTSTDNSTDATVQINPAFWADTITLDEVTKWGGSGMDPNTVYVINSGDNEVANLVVDLAGISWVQFVVYDADAATGDEAGNVTVYGRKY
jgi:hypothetical protein